MSALRELLAQLVAVPSPTGSEERLGEHLARLLRDRGLSVGLQQLEAQPRRFNVIARREGARPGWLIAGHLDTVPAAPSWEEPLRLRRAGDRLIGLGAWDMKAGLAAALSAIERLGPGAPALTVALLVDEEGESQGSYELLEDSGLRDRLLEDVAAVIVPEAAPEAPEGGLAITRARPGRIGLIAELHGEGGHGAVRRETDAVTLAARAVLALRSRAEDVHVRAIHASTGNALSAPERATLELDVFTRPGEPGPELRLRRLLGEELGPGPRLLLRPRPRRSPWLQAFELAADHPLVRAASEALARRGIPCALRVDRSPADENRFAAAGLPVISLSCRGGRAHAAGEWVSEAGLQILARGLTALLRCPPPRALRTNRSLWVCP